MTYNGVMYVDRRGLLYILVVIFLQVKIHITKGMIIASAERLSDA